MDKTIKIWNFGAGPALLPEDILIQAQSEFQNYSDTGMSILELSHRDAPVLSMMARAESDLRQLLEVPDTHDILFFQGGATTQFAAIPFNLIADFHATQPPVYLVNGTWSEAAFKESLKYFSSQRVSSFDELSSSSSSPSTSSSLAPPPYIYYCDNETVNGIEFPPGIPPLTSTWPERPLVVCDMSSNFISRPVDVERYDVIFAGAQKNSGIAGVTVVIVRKSLLDRAHALTPTMLSWRVAAAAKSNYNTPPVFAIYMAGLMFAWTLAQGGVDEMARRSEVKSQQLYQAIDASAVFRALVPLGQRSRMNVVFRIHDPETGLPSEALESQFVAESDRLGLKALKGHRSVGGLRASLYNAMSAEGVQTLIQFMHQFEEKLISK